MAHKLGSNEQVKTFILENVDKMKDKDMAVAISKLAGKDISVSTLRMLRKTMGLKKLPGRGISKLALSTVTPVDVVLSGEDVVEQESGVYIIGEGNV